MKETSDVTVVTDRGQVSIPSHLRRELGLAKGRKVLWQKVSDRELRVTVLDEGRPAGAKAMLGFARRFRPDARRTSDWLRELRECEAP